MSSASDPTPAMIDRAVAWRKFVNVLDTYFGEAATALEQRSEQSSRLASSVNEKDVNSLVPYFAPRGKSGVNDVIPTIVSMHESEAKAAAKAAKLIGTQLRSELDTLSADIEKSIEDFRGYSASFTEESGTPGTAAGAAKGQSTKEAYAGNTSTSAADLINGPLKPQIAQYQEAVAAAAAHKSPKVDPYILKLSIDKKLAKLTKGKSQLADSYAYTKDASKEVDAGVSDRLQAILGRYADAVGNQGQATLEGSSNLLGGFLAHPKLFEYNHFLKSSKAPKAFLSKEATQPQPEPQAKELAYPDEDSIYSKALRTGELERRTKFLHSYSPGEYVLTPQSLIEIKSGLPSWSLDLVGAKLLEDHKAADANQFVLQARQHGSSSGKQHTFVFRAKVAQNWRRELAAITAGQVPPSLESIVHAQNGPDATAAAPVAAQGSSAGTGLSRGPAPAYDEGFVDASSPTSATGFGSTTDPASSKATEPASAVAAAGGAATSGPRPDATTRVDSTEAIPPSSKFNMNSESPKPAPRNAGLGPEPTEPFPKVERSDPVQKNTAADSANPFGDPPSNASLTSVPVAGAAGAAMAEAPNFGHGAPAPTGVNHQRTLDPAAGSSSTAPYTGTNINPSAGYAGSSINRPADTPTAALSSLSTQDPTVQGDKNPFASTTSATTDRELGTDAPYNFKENQLQEPVDAIDSNQGNQFIGAGAPTGREFGKPEPYDFNENQLNEPVDNLAPSSNSGTDLPRGAAAGTVAGGAAGFNSRRPHDYIESELSHGDRLPEQSIHDTSFCSQPKGATATSGILDASSHDRGFYERSEDQLSHPVDRTVPRGYAGAGPGTAATSHLATGSHHDSDSEMSDTEQNFHDYFDPDDLEEPRKGTLAWQAKHDMQVFDKPVGYAAVDDPRPDFARTAEDAEDDASTWSYDATHQNALNTFRNDPNFKPADADLPVQTERRLTNTHHKLERPVVDPLRTDADALDDPEKVIQRRRSSVNAQTGNKLERSPSRRATGSYGDENELKPLSGLSSQERSQALSGDSALVFGDGLPNTTSGSAKF